MATLYTMLIHLSAAFECITQNKKPKTKQIYVKKKKGKRRGGKKSFDEND